MAMVFFYAEDGTTKVKLDSESSISISLPSKVSKSSIMDGTAVSDDVVEGNAVISIQGRVTYSKLTSQEKNLDPIKFQEALQEARRKGSRFTVYAQDNGQPLLKDYENCCISSVKITIDKFSDTITVGLVFEQVFVSQSAKLAYLAPVRSDSSAGTTSDTTNSGGGKKTQVDASTSRTILKGLVSNLINMSAQEAPDGTTN